MIRDKLSKIIVKDPMSIRTRVPNFLKSACLQISRDKGLTFATMLVMTLTLFITSVFAVVSLTANSVLGYLEGRPQITVFFKNDFAEDKILSVERDLKNQANIASVNYISKDDALKFYLGEHRNEQNLIESVSSDIFPPALEIKAQKISDLESVAQKMSKMEGVDEVVFFRDVINTFKSWVDASRVIGLSLISVLAFISLFIILITIGMTIRSRGEEIEIMKLLGATDGYIRLPFLTQGFLYGLTSGLSSTLGLLILSLLVVGKIGLILRGITAPPFGQFVIIVSVSQIFLGIILGMLGAWLSTKRYLRI